MIDKTMPVSREDYDLMADQRDAFRAALKTAETYLEGALGYAQQAEDDCPPADETPAPFAEDLFHVRAALQSAQRCARAGLDAVKKTL